MALCGLAGINFGDQLSRGTNCLGDHLSMVTKWAGTVCASGPIVLGTICPWGPNEPGLFVLGDQLWGTKCPGTECVRDQMRCSPRGGKPKYFAPTKALIVVQSNLVIRNVLIRNKLVLRNHFPWPIVNLLRKDKEHLTNIRTTRKFFIAKFDCTLLEIKEMQLWQN